MFKKCSTMNLLASYSISILDVLDIIGQGKTEEEKEELKEIISRNEMNDDGFLDYDEFSTFLDSLQLHR